MSDEKRVIHIRTKNDNNKTLCDAEPRSSISHLHYKHAQDNPLSVIGWHITKFPEEICSECVRVYNEVSN